ncbi:SDR family NAD(P)-dependent oxidoreductase [Paenibacillus mucilaginosus]|uniref:Short-chain dehydrogenase/reductase SDR n=1 Tax=Paenibacillus mucilaginosus (strain KNP414) TaxID=1036673 RepID=F8F5E2_PAEMK|nr:SDR family NAD(P)-dependent oxidoreductase [Paenibacillus mucilaginosus]AEI40953.1 short-chain dehydrogenase/reductase SDR [Paenibacillus mucilaginosus KNP414]MCG7211597.1 SDR family NAD(P)-dependent oxidoreductase [Paenibacillus mucilaginosus]WDM30039.1 SDR family NAD(P)-dependent oxidoreductase [Paenibacillus mucilaginosus]
MAEHRRVCVTGTDRGVGLALTESLLHAGCTVFAGGISRENPEMDRLKEAFPQTLHAFYLDVGSDESVREAGALIRSRTDALDVLINNAALLGDTSVPIEGELDFDEMLRVYDVSALGAIRMSNALIGPLMNGGKLIVNISSEAGSITQSYREAWFGYCMAKSALNMGSTIIHNRIRRDGGRVLLFHPGWVKTYMSGTWNDAGTYTPQEAAENILRRIDEYGSEIREQPIYIEADTGRELPW